MKQINEVASVVYIKKHNSLFLLPKLFIFNYLNYFFFIAI